MQLTSCPYISGQWGVMILHWCHCNPFNITISNIRTRCITITGHTTAFLLSYQPTKTPAHTNPELCFGRTSWTCLILGTSAAFFQKGSDSTYKPWEQREGNLHPEFLLSLSSCLKPGNPAVKKQRKLLLKGDQDDINPSLKHLPSSQFVLSFLSTDRWTRKLTHTCQTVLPMSVWTPFLVSAISRLTFNLLHAQEHAGRPWQPSPQAQHVQQDI